MNSHKNARTTYEGRRLLIERIAVLGLMPAAEAAGISVRTARKWKKRFEAMGVAGLLDQSSRPHKTRTSLDAGLVERIERLRRARTPMRTIGRVVGRSVATISRTLKVLGLSSLKALDPASLVGRYERAAPGELLHIDTRSSDASCARATGSPAIDATRSMAQDGSSRMWPSTTTPGLASCKCTATRRRLRLCSSFRTPWRTTRRSAFASSAC